MPGAGQPKLEARTEAARLGALLAASGDAKRARPRLSRLRADAELRYRGARRAPSALIHQSSPSWRRIETESE